MIQFDQHVYLKFRKIVGCEICDCDGMLMISGLEALSNISNEISWKQCHSTFWNTIPEWRIFWLYFRGMISIAGGRVCQNAIWSIHQYHRHSHALIHQKFQVSKMQLLSLFFGYFGQWFFPLHKPYPYQLILRWGFLHLLGTKKRLVNHPLSRSKPCGIILPCAEMNKLAVQLAEQ